MDIDSNLILVDTHAHYYPFYPLPDFLDAGHKNLKDIAQECGQQESFTGIICLLETKTSHWYQDLIKSSDTSDRVGEWQIESEENEQFIRFSKDKNVDLLVVPGQQIITSENLEIIVIGASHPIPHQREASYYIEEYNEKYLVIIPWGVGKWLGTRGKVVDSLLQRFGKHQFALGDNSGRPKLWRHVPQFKQAKQLGINILNGSDPLPIHGQQKKLGCFVSKINGPLSIKTNLSKEIREKLLDTTPDSIQPYGHLDNLYSFLKSQFLLRTSRLKEY